MVGDAVVAELEVFAAPTRILVLDEATSAMDSGTRQSMTLHCGRVIKVHIFSSPCLALEGSYSMLLTECDSLRESDIYLGVSQSCTL